MKVLSTVNKKAWLNRPWPAEVNEMKILRKMVGKTKIDRIRSQQIRESCGIQAINEWVEQYEQ